MRVCVADLLQRVLALERTLEEMTPQLALLPAASEPPPTTSIEEPVEHHGWRQVDEPTEEHQWSPEEWISHMREVKRKAYEDGVLQAKAIDGDRWVVKVSGELMDVRGKFYCPHCDKHLDEWNLAAHMYSKGHKRRMASSLHVQAHAKPQFESTSHIASKEGVLQAQRLLDGRWGVQGPGGPMELQNRFYCPACSKDLQAWQLSPHVSSKRHKNNRAGLLLDVDPIWCVLDQIQPSKIAMCKQPEAVYDPWQDPRNDPWLQGSDFKNCKHRTPLVSARKYHTRYACKEATNPWHKYRGLEVQSKPFSKRYVPAHN